MRTLKSSEHPFEEKKDNSKRMIHAIGAGLARRATVATFLEPKVHLKSATITSVWGGRLDVVLSLHNPNLFEVDAKRTCYKITKVSDGTLLAEGALEKPYNVAARGVIEIVLPVTVSYGGMGAAGSSLVKRGVTDFVISGDMTIETIVAGNVTIPFRDLEGQLVLE
jgi:hypothetical protein